MIPVRATSALPYKTPLLEHLGLTPRELYLMSIGKKPRRSIEAKEPKEPTIYRFSDYRKNESSTQIEQN